MQGVKLLSLVPGAPLFPLSQVGGMLVAEQCPPSLSWALAGWGRQQPRPPVTKEKGQKHALGFVPNAVP